MSFLKKDKELVLYWEDIGERLLYAELDDYAWKLPEKIFGYSKKKSLYIYHSGRLSAYYSKRDSKREAEIGYKFYSSEQNIKDIVSRKKEIADKVNEYCKRVENIDVKLINEQNLNEHIQQCLSLYQEALGTHYLTQPQFFEKFECGNTEFWKKELKELSDARFTYTRSAWTKAINLVKNVFLPQYAQRHDCSIEVAESQTFEEFKNGFFDKTILTQRAEKYVFISKSHNIDIHTGQVVNDYIKLYENYSGISSVKGVTGHKGKKQGRAFVVSNENLDLKNLPLGMTEGDILVIQNAWPEFTSYYGLATAIVTNEGGITSHGVVVAREKGIPCIVGTKIATKIFKTGDLVEVDADKGIVRILNK